MKNERYELNKELAQMLKCGVIIDYGCHYTRAGSNCGDSRCLCSYGKMLGLRKIPMTINCQWHFIQY